MRTCPSALRSRTLFADSQSRTKTCSCGGNRKEAIEDRESSFLTGRAHEQSVANKSSNPTIRHSYDTAALIVLHCAPIGLPRQRHRAWPPKWGRLTGRVAASGERRAVTRPRRDVASPFRQRTTVANHVAVSRHRRRARSSRERKFEDRLGESRLRRRREPLVEGAEGSRLQPVPLRAVALRRRLPRLPRGDRGSGGRPPGTARA